MRLQGGVTIGFEALLRWRHPELGTIPPDKFIGLAEETALIVPIGRSVLSRACRDLVSFEERLGRAIVMSVNVSGRQFAEPSFLSELKTVIEETGVNPRSLKLEITEGVLMDHRSRPLGWIRELQETRSEHRSRRLRHRFLQLELSRELPHRHPED